MKYQPYLIRKKDKFICSNCRMAGRLRPACDFCKMLFSNYESMMAEVLHDYEIGCLTSTEIYDIIDLEDEEDEEDG